MEGYSQLSNGSCIYCNQYQKFDQNLQKCIPNCGQFAIYIESSAYCVCINGYYTINGVCGQCQNN